MVKYTCKRCGYNTNIKTHLLNHYKRKKTCNNVLKGPEINQCILELTESNNIKFKNAFKCVQLRWLQRTLIKTYKNALECVENALECVGNKKISENNVSVTIVVKFSNIEDI